MIIILSRSRNIKKYALTLLRSRKKNEETFGNLKNMLRSSEEISAKECFFILSQYLCNFYFFSEVRYPMAMTVIFPLSGRGKFWSSHNPSRHPGATYSICLSYWKQCSLLVFIFFGLPVVLGITPEIRANNHRGQC